MQLDRTNRSWLLAQYYWLPLKNMFSPHIIILLTFSLATVSFAQKPASEDPTAEKYYIGNSAYNRKLYPVAAAQYQAFLRAYPKHAKVDRARFGLGLSQFALKQYPNAAISFTTLLEKPNMDPGIDRDRLVMLKGQSLLHSAKKEQGKALLIAEIPKFKNKAYRAAALVAIGDLTFQQAQWKELIPWTDQLLKMPEATPDQRAAALYQQASAHYHLKNPTEALTTLTKAPVQGILPAWITRIQYLTGECHRVLKQLPEAETAFASALEKMSGSRANECRFRLSEVRFLLKKFPEAQAGFDVYIKEAQSRLATKIKTTATPLRYLEARLYAARCQLQEKATFGRGQANLNKLIADEKSVAIAPRAALWLARSYGSHQRYETAIVSLTANIKKFPRVREIPILQFELGSAYMFQKVPDWKLAAVSLSHAWGRIDFLQRAEALSQRAICYHKLKLYAQSLRDNELFLKELPEHLLVADVSFLRAENLFLLNKYDEATIAYKQYIATYKKHAKNQAAQFRTAQILHITKKWPASLAIAQPLFAQKPEGRLFSQLAFLIGDCYFQQGKWAESIPPFEQFITASSKVLANKKKQIIPDTNVDTGLLKLALAYDRTGKKTEALQHLDTLVRYPARPITPHLPLAYTEQGRIAYQNGNNVTARRAFQGFLLAYAKGIASKTPPFNLASTRALVPQVNYYLAWVDTTEKRYLVAAENFIKVPRTHPLAADAFLQSGIAFVKAEKFAQAGKQFQNTAAWFPKHEKRALLIYYSGLAQARVENWRVAQTHFKNLIEKETPDPSIRAQALYEWAWCCRAIDQKKEATAIYQQLLSQYPKHALAIKVQSELAELNLDAGAQEKVIAELTETLKKVGDDAKLKESISIQLASAHYKVKDYPKAAVQFEALIKEYPKSLLLGSMLFQAGESRLKIKETVAAREHFATAAKLHIKDVTLAEPVFMRLAETQSMTREYEAAIKTYAQFLARFPQSIWKRNAQFGRAYATELAGQSGLAIRLYQTLNVDIKQDVWAVRGRFQTGECYFNLKQYDLAQAEFIHVDTTFTRYPAWRAKAVLEMGRVLLSQNKRAEAETRFHEVIRRFGKEKAAIVARQYLDELKAAQ